MKTKNKAKKHSLILLLSVTLVLLMTSVLIADKPIPGSTTLVFSVNPATLSGDSAPDVTITTTTTSAASQPVIDAGKVMIELATDGLPFYNPVPAASVVTWVALNAPGQNPATGITTLDVDLDALGFVGGTVGGFRAHYVTGGGGGDKVATHTSDPVDLTAIVPLGSISGAKFYDLDTDGLWDVGEPAIEGWMVHLTGDIVDEYAFTDADGEFIFEDLEPGSYTVEEILPPAPPTWVPTTDTSFSHDLGAGENYVGPDFGNVCLGPGGGHTKGYWGNPNGETTMSKIPTALSALTALNLVDADGNPFNPGTYNDLDIWLQGANATNMAYMLSAQLAAMKLNVMAEEEPAIVEIFVDGDALVYAPGVPGANAAGFISVNDLITAADVQLGLDSYTPDGDPNR
ncbi:MAG: hypothetical protein JSV03_06725, partial [Planctomycetota bacterium]